MLLTREKLQDRLIALHEASLELVKDVSLETLLERIAQIACELVEARYAALGVLDEAGKLERFISFGMTVEQSKRIPHTPRGMGLIGALMHSSEIIRIPEIMDDARSLGFPKGHPHMHSFLGVPIRLGDQQLGQIYLTDKIDSPEFTVEDEKIIEILAAYASVAIQNAHLYSELQKSNKSLNRRIENYSLLSNIDSALDSSLELEEILNKTLALLFEHFGMEAGDIFLLEEDLRTLRLVLHRGELVEALWTRNRFKIGEGPVGLAALKEETIAIKNLAKNKHFLREAVIQTGFCQIICVPLKVNNQLDGVFSIATRNHKSFDTSEIRLLTSIGEIAGAAIKNARLHYNARRFAVLQERERIGMDLHDGVIQSIYGVGLILENARSLLRENNKQADDHLQKAIDDLNHTIHDIRNYILDLKPRQLHSENLIEGLNQLIMEFRQNTNSSITLSGPKNDHLTNLAQTHAMALFHICQEALANVAKHAKAQKVTVDLWTTSDRVLLEIHDNGDGFDVKKISKTVGHGLSNMQTRVQNEGGDLEVMSNPREGTTILAWVPRMLSR